MKRKRNKNYDNRKYKWRKLSKIDGNNTDHFEINETDTSINIETDVHEKLYKSLYWVKVVR